MALNHLQRPQGSLHPWQTQCPARARVALPAVPCGRSRRCPQASADLSTTLLCRWHTSLLFKQPTPDCTQALKGAVLACAGHLLQTCMTIAHKLPFCQSCRADTEQHHTAAGPAMK